MASNQSRMPQANGPPNPPQPAAAHQPRAGTCGSCGHLHMNTCRSDLWRYRGRLGTHWESDQPSAQLLEKHIREGRHTESPQHRAANILSLPDVSSPGYFGRETRLLPAPPPPALFTPQPAYYATPGGHTRAGPSGTHQGSRNPLVHDPANSGSNALAATANPGESIAQGAVLSYTPPGSPARAPGDAYTIASSGQPAVPSGRRWRPIAPRPTTSAPVRPRSVARSDPQPTSFQWVDVSTLSTMSSSRASSKKSQDTTGK